MKLQHGLIVLTLLAAPAFADWRMQEPYLLVGLGESEFDGYNRIPEQDDSDVAFRVGAGATAIDGKLGRIGAELSYVDFGQTTGVNTQIGADGWSAELTADSPVFFDKLRIGAHGGAWAWNVVSNFRDESGTDWLAGAHLTFQLSDAWAIVPRWTRYTIAERDLDLLELSVHTTF
jgi:hypothetical protein